MREAIKSLTSEGLVEIVPAKGAVVRRLTEQDLTQILQVLKVIEQLGVRLTCERASDETIRDICELHNRMIKLYKAGNRLEYFKLNQAIHTSFVQASGNAVLAECTRLFKRASSACATSVTVSHRNGPVP